MGSSRLWQTRTVAALVAVACAGGLAACGSDGGSGTAAASDSARPSAATTTATAAGPAGGAASGAGASSGAGSAANTQPCDLLTAAMAGRVLGKAVSAPDLNSPTTCQYALHGDDYGDLVSLAVEKWQDGRTVQDEVKDLAVVGKAAQQPASGLSPDAVLVSMGSDYAVVWKAGDVHKLYASNSDDPNGTRDRLLDVARQIYTAEQK